MSKNISDSLLELGQAENMLGVFSEFLYEELPSSLEHADGIGCKIISARAEMYTTVFMAAEKAIRKVIEDIAEINCKEGKAS